MIKFSVNEIKNNPEIMKKSMAEGIHETRFQMCTGGRVDILFGQNLGQDYFPSAVGLRLACRADVCARSSDTHATHNWNDFGKSKLDKKKSWTQ